MILHIIFGDLLIMEKLKCPICGEPTSVYMGNARKDRLCRKHGKELKEGLIEQCSDCGEWKKVGEECECKKKKNKERIIGESCLDCGDPSNGYFFCKKCYYKYKNKSVILKITNCNEVEILDSGYESKITCEDGHPVKSQQEAMIDDYLYHHNIKHIYEKPLSIDEDPEHDLHPDFYLPDYDLYIEHFGITGNKEYEKSKEYKLSIYKKLNITLIVTTGKDITNLSANLERKLRFIKKGEINYLDE